MVDEPSRALVAQGLCACLAEMMVDINGMTERRDCAPAGYRTGSCLSPWRAVQGRGKGTHLCEAQLKKGDGGRNSVYS